MSDQSDFFGDVFDDPEDDPLLGGGEPSSDDAPEESRRAGPPSWMSEEERVNGDAGAHAPEEDTGAERKQIVVDQRPNARSTGIQALNRAVGQGWRLVRIAVLRPNGEPADATSDAHRFLAVLEEERPQSLFDFGAG
jgi:hypothetical protein